MFILLATIIVLFYIISEIKGLVNADSGEFLGKLLGYAIIFFILSAVFG